MNAVDVLDYYYRGPLPVRPLRLELVQTPERLDGRLDELVADAGGAWVVLTRPEDLDPRGAFAPHLEARYPQAERFDFEGINVWHVARPGGSGAP